MNLHTKSGFKTIFKPTFKQFKKFMKSQNMWFKFKFAIFKYYGSINVENFLAENSIMPPEYLNMPTLIYDNKSIDWGRLSIKWQAVYYKIEESI